MWIIGRPWTDLRRVPEVGWIRLDGPTIGDLGIGPLPDAAAGPVAGDPSWLILPGFVDAHTHLPQFGQTGRPSFDLLAWLDTVIFPAETRWSEPAVAERAARAALRQMAAAGTLTAAVYGSSHHHAIAAIERAHADVPIDLLAGIPLMDRSGPEALRVPGLPPLPGDAPRLRWSVTPRFALSCSDGQLEAAGTAAGSGGRFVQTHLAEQRAECDAVAARFTDDPHYVAVYERFGLLHERSLLAHAIHMSDPMWTRMAERQAVAVHCPTANTFLGSGHFDLAAARRHGVRVALGSDVAAGADVSMPVVARAMLEVATHRWMAGATAEPPAAVDAWRMITEDGAAALGRPTAGRIAVGAEATVLGVVPGLPWDALDAAPDDFAARLLYTWSDARIESRWVHGTPLRGFAIDPDP